MTTEDASTSLPKKILIVEDNDLTIKILEHIFKKEGYHLTLAKDGLQAIEKVAEVQPDIILTDVMLPYKNGIEIVSHVKKNFHNIPVVLISALGEEEGVVTKAFSLGADDFVAKPFNPNELLLRIKRLLISKSAHSV